jgi:enediyne biosynthesis protein E4
MPRPASTPTPPAGHAGPVPTFTDVTAAVGLHWRHSNGGRGQKHYPETIGGGGGFVDVDGDGWLDIVLIDSAPPPGGSTVTLLHNEPAEDRRPPTADDRRPGGLMPAVTRRFVDRTKGSGLESRFYGIGLTAGDMDGDGKVDLYVTALGRNHLFRNDGGGHFTDVTAQAGVESPGFSTSAAFVDYDRDGDLDLFVCHYLRWDPRTEPPCYAGDRVRIYCPPGRYPGEPSALYRNDGRGRYRDVTDTAGIRSPAGKALGVAVCDLNSDGRPDLYVANDLEPNNAFVQTAEGRFEDRAPELGLAVSPAGRARAGMGVDARSLGLGKLDFGASGRGTTVVDPRLAPALLVGNFQTEGAALFVPGADGFVERTDAAGLLKPTLDSLTFGCGLVDVDLDGFPDVVLLNGHVEPDIARYQPGQRYRQRPQLFLATPAGVFVEAGAQAGIPFQRVYAGRGLAWGDYDNDGDLDFLAIENNGAAHLWRNDGPHGHWLTVVPDRGMGARVTLRAGGRMQEQVVRTGSSYLTVSDPRLIFGLGPATVADEVRVHWPDGHERRWTDVPADHIWPARR